MVMGLIEEVADHGAQRAGEDEGRPEEQSARDGGLPIKKRQKDQQTAENRSAPQITEIHGVGAPIPKSRSEGLGTHDCDPVEEFSLWSADRLDGHASKGFLPRVERGQEESEQ